MRRRPSSTGPRCRRAADANLANIRLGAALALAGKRAEAETAFRAVTGPRAELAQLWLLWLSQALIGGEGVHPRLPAVPNCDAAN